MTIREQIISASEQVFDQHGFAGSGVDRLTAAANVSSRTLYKHLQNKTGVAVAVLTARKERFFHTCDAQSTAELFDALRTWTAHEGSRGCLFLRAYGEIGEAEPQIAAVVAAYRDQLRTLLARLVRHDTGAEDDELAEQLLILVEGAVSASSYRGPRAIDAAYAAAAHLIDAHTAHTD